MLQIHIIRYASLQMQQQSVLRTHAYAPHAADALCEVTSKSSVPDSNSPSSDCPDIAHFTCQRHVPTDTSACQVYTDIQIHVRVEDAC